MLPTLQHADECMHELYVLHMTYTESRDSQMMIMFHFIRRESITHGKLKSHHFKGGSVLRACPVSIYWLKTSDGL